MPRSRTPRNSIELLRKLAGEWQGTYRLWMNPKQAAQEAPTVAQVREVAQGRFLRLDYTWSLALQPHDGSILFGLDSARSEHFAHWVDSFHMSDKVMDSRGADSGNSSVDVLGSYPAPPGPDWGWRTIVKPGKDGSFTVKMFNITPQGEEQRAVEARYTKA